MSDGKTKSLDYLSARFAGSVDADTSKPTAEGNYWVLEGMLRAYGIPIERATVGLIGLGNIGMHVLERLRSNRARVIGIELRAERRAAAAAAGATAWLPSDKQALLDQPIDALVVNAAGGTLDSDTVRTCIANETLRVVCGSENLAMANPDDAERLREGRKSFCPTELGGMMGYLTAVEEYLAHLEDQSFDVRALFEAAKWLEPA
jgi:glutamate dehydrogenase/leucine dehydrogenase